jgi:hypothetical protein
MSVLCFRRQIPQMNGFAPILNPPARQAAGEARQTILRFILPFHSDKGLGADGLLHGKPVNSNPIDKDTPKRCVLLCLSKKGPCHLSCHNGLI